MTAEDNNNNNSLGHWQTFFNDWKDGNSGKLHLDVRNSGSIRDENVKSQKKWTETHPTNLH